MKTIKEEASKLRKEFDGKYDIGTNLRAQDVSVWIEETYIEAAEYVQKWISIEDELPETNEQVIVKFENSEGCWYGISNYVKQDKKWDNFSPSHWRPINRK